MAKLEDRMEQVLERHRLEMMRHLDAWLESVEQSLGPQVRPMPSTPTRQKRPSLRSAPTRGEGLSDRMNSYDAARLTHTRVVEASAAASAAATSQVEALESIPESPKAAVLRSWQEKVGALMASQTSSLFFSMLIITNSLFLGLQLEWQSAAQDISSGEEIFLGIHIGYAVVFSVEVCLRLFAEGFWPYVWQSSDWAWNWLDIFVVSSTWAELIALLVTPGTSTMGANRNLRALRLLRIGRIVRVVRVARVARLFRSLRTLINSLMGTLKALFWSLLLLCLIIYMFAILFTDAVLDHRATSGWLESRDEEYLAKYYGGMYNSIETLFRSISSGLTWEEAADTLRVIENGEFWVQLFHFYVAFCSFAVLNVMTGVFCNAAIKAAENDHELRVLSLLQTRKELTNQVQNLFHKIDERGEGQVTIGEFEKHFADESVMGFFESLEIGAMDAWTLFMSLIMLRKNGDNHLSRPGHGRGPHDQRGGVHGAVPEAPRPRAVRGPVRAAPGLREVWSSAS
ncbi:unnamed protein product [Effrenium voratum]|uniref:EF-hand domain-containing protein n=1 Tax=Effrenium voratum TaxID=2562239 RepID=A0AA36IAA4_9DINO|nr:unnamed protein product [Effrenium voratum]